jgi:broad specificity phosphatase PhoE
MKHLYFVRHGLSLMNQQGVWSGITDTPLTKEGEAQAREAGRQLKTARIDYVVSSPVRRAHDTAVLIAEEIGYPVEKIVINDHFIERDFGPLEGTPYKANMPLDDMDGVEHSSDLVARVSEGLEFLQTVNADTILVVSHGAVGRALHHLTEDGLSFHETKKFENAQVEKLL